MLFGAEPGAVEASVIRDPVSGVDTLTSAILEFDDGVATFTCSTRVETDQRVHVYGSEGRLSIEIPFNIPPDRPTHVFVTAGGDPPVAPAIETVDLRDEGPVHRRGRALRGRHPGRPADPDPAGGRGRQPARHRADLRGREPRAGVTTRSRVARLADIPLPDFGMPDAEPPIPAEVYAARLERLREAMDRRGYDRLVIYADREHSANLAWLTGFDPRFEEAIAVVGPTEQPAILVGNECFGTAGAAPLPMRRILFQDLSLPGQPRDRPGRWPRSSRDEGIGAGRRVGVVGWKTYARPEPRWRHRPSSSTSCAG